jgi:acyl-CoA synthetase (AMP-forming)/AMP-acid ligase II
MVDEYDLSSVKMITSGAAPLTKELVDAVYKRLGIRINQAYGLSETSPMTHTQVCLPALLSRFLFLAILIPTPMILTCDSPGTNGTPPSAA